MISKFRITKRARGYIVEVQDIRWTLFGLKTKWVPYVKTSGLEECWHHSNENFAIQNLFFQIKSEL